MLCVKKINFETIRDYWIEVNHFDDPNKQIHEVIYTLGPHNNPYEDPRRISYGLFDEEKLIGATQLVQWSETHVRYRTLNVREQYRGKDLGWYLLNTAYHQDWQMFEYIFGWIRDTHWNWAKRHDFVETDQHWTDNHIAMQRLM